MIFTATNLIGAYVIELDPIVDERGFFARSFCADEFGEHGLATAMTQCSVSFNAARGTLRGLHFQVAPRDEEKLVRCTAGRIFDVVVDIRPSSPTFRQWYGTELSAENHRAMYVPKGFAHGFVTLTGDTEVLYMISVAYAPGFAGGYRWNDPAFAIRWPIEPVVISSRDAAYPPFVAPEG